MKRFERAAKILTQFAGIPILLVLGCARQQTRLPIEPNDLQALRNIYDASGAVFYGSQLDVRVQSGGTVELELQGRVEYKPPFQTGLNIPADSAPDAEHQSPGLGSRSAQTVSSKSSSVVHPANDQASSGRSGYEISKVSLPLKINGPNTPDLNTQKPLANGHSSQSTATQHSRELPVDDLAQRLHAKNQIELHLDKSEQSKLLIESQRPEQAASEVDLGGEVWIPLLLTRTLPAYFRLEPGSSSDKPSATLEAYQFRDGMWCLAVVVEPRGPGTRSDRAGNDQIDIHVVLADPVFAKNLPFIIPSGQTQEPLAVSVSLPKGAKFLSDNGEITMPSVRDWRSRQDFSAGFGGQTSVLKQDLTSIPSATAVSSPQQAATMYSPDSIGWDFSKVEFTQPGFLASYRPWYLPSLGFLVCCGAMILLLILRSNIDEPRLKGADWGDLQSVGRAALASISNLAGEKNEDPEILQRVGSWKRRLQESLQRLLRSYPDFKAQAYWKRLNDIVGIELEVSAFLVEQEGKRHPQAVMIDRLTSLLWEIQKLTTGVKEELFLARYRQQRRILNLVFLGFGVAALVALIFLVSSIARAQTHPSPKLARIVSGSMLCDLDIALTPRDPQTSPADRVDVNLRFSPLSSIRDRKTGTLRIGPGDGNSIHLEDPPIPTDKNLSVLQHSSTLITLGFPETYSTILARITALSGLIQGFKVPDDYPKALAKANQFNFSYTLNGAEIKHERVSGQSHWLYMFPFDSVDVDVPIDIRSDSLLWHLELQKPNGDLFTTPDVDGLSISLAETENGDKYVFASPDERSRTSVTPQQRIMVHARFERTAFQRWGLTIGVWCAAVVVGVLAGFADKLPTHWVALLVGLLGVSGLIFGVRNTVLGTYKWLPTLASFQGTSIFELCWVVALALMVIAFLIARK